MSAVTCAYSPGVTGYGELYQWDTGVTLEVTGLDVDEAPVFHFCHRGDDTAETVDATLEDDTASALIPDEFLEENKTILVYITVASGTEVHTMGEVWLHVHKRTQPSDTIYEEA